MNSNKDRNSANLEFPLLEALSEEHAPEASHPDWSRLMRALPYTSELHAPPPELKQKVLAAVRDAEAGAQAATVQLWKNWSAPQVEGDLIIQRKQEGQWEETGVTGVEVKRLFVDQNRNYVTMLVRMRPGSSYPGHRHGGFEECYVLQGDLSVGDTVLRAGDYQRAAGGSIHGEQSTRNGCVLFIVSSQQDELLV